MLLICCLVLGGYKECANKLESLNFILRTNLVFVEVLRSRASKQACKQEVMPEMQ